ncbi:MAG: hypothetical protein ACREX3_25130 [Gammaproteobacteria bacterium]
MEHAAALSRQEVVWALMLQLLGLATPLFTQTIIDKVVVHQTFSTLTVIGVALFVCMVHRARTPAKTINAFQGTISALFITHHLPRGLLVDAVVRIGGPGEEQHMSVVTTDRTP